MACEGDGVEVVIEPNIETVTCDGCDNCKPREEVDDE